MYHEALFLAPALALASALALAPALSWLWPGVCPSLAWPGLASAPAWPGGRGVAVELPDKNHQFDWRNHRKLKNQRNQCRKCSLLIKAGKKPKQTQKPKVDRLWRWEGGVLGHSLSTLFFLFFGFFPTFIGKLHFRHWFLWFVWFSAHIYILIMSR